MNVEFINPFISSLTNVLTTMGGIECKISKPRIKEGNISCGDVSGIIGMVGNKVKGSIAISFSKPVILDIVEKMVGDKLTEIDDTVKDMVGELTNMTTGGAKNLLSEKGYDFDMATPVIIAGEGHEITHKSKAQIILIPFESSAGDFFIEISFEDQ